MGDPNPAMGDMNEKAARYTEAIDIELKNLERTAITTSITCGILGVAVGIAISTVAVTIGCKDQIKSR